MLGMSTTFLSIHNGVEGKNYIISCNTMWYILGKYKKLLDEGGL